MQTTHHLLFNLQEQLANEQACCSELLMYCVCTRELRSGIQQLRLFADPLLLVRHVDGSPRSGPLGMRHKTSLFEIFSGMPRLAHVCAGIPFVHQQASCCVVHGLHKSSPRAEDRGEFPIFARQPFRRRRGGGTSACSADRSFMCQVS